MLVGSKARVAPLEKAGVKVYTVPRLELLSCVILSQFMETVEKSFIATGFKISEKRFYTDSTINLGRIRGQDKEFQQWVQNRVSGIRSKTQIDDWYYVPTKLNASDLPSRGCSLKDLKSCDMWMYGPEFIREEKIKLFDYNKTSVVEPELKASILLSMEETKNVKSVGNLPNDYLKNLKGHVQLHNVMDILRFSNLKKLIHVTAYVLRFVFKGVPLNALNADELERAKLMWISSEQKRYAQSDKENFVKTGNNLCFVLENDIIRCKGRLKNADLPYDMKFPIFLPAASVLTDLIIKQAHDEVFHQKVSPTLTQLRTEYWVPRGRQIVRKLLLKCALCNLYDASPYKPSSSPVLPKYRVELVPPFQNVGTDHVGPLFVRDIYSIEKETHKCYIHCSLAV